MTRSVGTVVFSHGKESGPWGSKITAMAAVVRDLGVEVESVDYRGLDDPATRVRKLIGVGASLKDRLLLVGSSMGGHVSRRLEGRDRTIDGDVHVRRARLGDARDNVVPVGAPHLADSLRRPPLTADEDLGDGASLKLRDHVRPPARRRPWRPA